MFRPRARKCTRAQSSRSLSDVFAPTVFVDLSQYLGVKLEAMMCYESQLVPSPRARSLASIEALARVRGDAIGVPAAEAFGSVREVLL